MPGITVTRESLAATGAANVTEERFEAVSVVVLNLIGSVYKGAVDTAEGRAASVLNSVFFSVVLRLLTNPAGARAIGLGSANVTFGGLTGDVGNSAALTSDEADSLRSLTGGKPSFVRFTPGAYQSVALVRPARRASDYWGVSP